jgi:hypothetical protein
VREQARLVLQLLVGLLQLLGEGLRLLEQVLITMPIDSVSWSRNAWCAGLNSSSEASSITPRTSPSNTTGSTSTSCAVCSERPVAMRKLAPGTAERLSFLFSIAHCPTRPSPRSTCLPCARWPPEA